MDSDVANALGVLNSLKEQENDRLPVLVDGYRLHHGDCLEVMRQLRSASVEAVITDPPYGTTEDDKSKVIMGTDGVKKFGHEWDKELPLDWIFEASRILKDGGSFFSFCDTKKIETMWNTVEKAGIRPLQIFYWKKPNAGINPRKNFCSAVECAIFGRKPGKVIHWGGGGASPNVYECPTIKGADRIHPTQKPIRLMRHLIKILAPRHGVVFDPFMGAATTGVAALAMDCFFEGIEMDPQMFEKAKKRIHLSSKQRNLFFTDSIESSYTPPAQGDDNEEMASEELEVSSDNPVDILFMEERKKSDPLYPTGADTDSGEWGCDCQTDGSGEPEDGSESTGDREEGN